MAAESDVNRTHQEFTQKERDTESGLDFFLARYYSGAQGRFTSVDPVSLKVPNSVLIADPQRWNSFTYALNNPLKNIDRDGRFSEPVHTWTTTQAGEHHGYGASAIAIMNVANKHVDSGSNFINNKEHGMQDSYRTEKQGYAATAKVLTDKLNKAVESAVKGDYSGALNSLGEGSHTAQDLSAHGMMYLVQHPWSEVSIDNDAQKVTDGLAGTEDYFSSFETLVTQTVGGEKGQKILSELKAFSPEIKQPPPLPKKEDQHLKTRQP
jgi:RHS repeat-associated protein